jgi:WD40 repeat protein
MLLIRCRCSVAILLTVICVIAISWLSHKVHVRPDAIIGNGDRYVSMRYSPNGRYLIAANKEVLDVWDVAASRRRAQLKCGQAEFARLAMSENGQILTIAHRDGQVDVIELETGAVVRTFATAIGNPTQLCLSEDGRLLAVGDDRHGAISVWSVDGSGNAAILNGTGSEAVISPNSTMVALKDPEDASISIWDTRKRGALVALPGAYAPITFSPDSQLGASAGGHEWAAFVRGPQVPVLTTRRRGSKTVQLWNVNQSLVATTLKGHNRYVTAVAFSPNGQLLASSACVQGRPGGHQIAEVKLWEVPTGRELETIPLRDIETGGLSSSFDRWVNKLRFSADSQTLEIDELASVQQKSFWDISVSPPIERCHVCGDQCISPHGTLIGSVWDSNKIPASDVLSAIASLVPLPGQNGKTGAEMSPDGRTLALWARYRARQSRFQELLSRILPLSRDPDIRCDVLVVDIAAGQVCARLSDCFLPSFSADSLSLACQDREGRIAVWHLPLPKAWSFALLPVGVALLYVVAMLVLIFWNPTHKCLETVSQPL